MSLFGVFDTMFPSFTTYEEFQYGDPEADARGTWLERHTWSTGTGVEIGQTVLERHQLGRPQSKLETSRSGNEEFEVRFRRLDSPRGQGASPEEINLDKLGAMSPTNGSSYGYDTSSALGEGTSTPQASSNYWSPEQYSHCIYALAAIVGLWTQPLLFPVVFWHCTIVGTLPPWYSNV
jgi:hypothetical protein